MVEFVEEVIAGLLSDQEVRTFEEVMVPVFDIFQGRVKDLDLCQPVLYSYLDVLLYFSHNKDIAKVRHYTQLLYYQMSLYSIFSVQQVVQFTVPINQHTKCFFYVFQVLVEHIQPKDPANGLQYQKSLLGVVLSVSCLLKTPGVVEGHGYFLNPSRSSAQETKVQEANIHQVKRFCLAGIFAFESYNDFLYMHED